MITAPFNFVPLNEQVFFPPWAEDVNHDVPFEDGESGEIEVTITAKSPIFIRNHSDDKNNPSTEFCNYNGEYYIPATSVKGMVRNVLEIMSFSKMNQFDDDTYAVRDLSRSDNFYMTQMKEDTFCGWLKKNGGDYIIEDCGIPLRIHHDEIDKALNVDFASHFHEVGFEKTSEYKYNLIGGELKQITVSSPYKSKKNKYDTRLFCDFDKKGQKGILVLTGQPTPRQNNGQRGDGKGFEFVFLDVKREVKIDKKVFENFKFAYFDKRDTQPKESLDWKYWKEKLYNGEKIPVFFQKQENKIKHFGLSYLYKLPYEYSIKDGIKDIHFDDRADMTETIFGYVNKQTKQSLKGRVYFSHFKANGNILELSSRTEILGTPRASYYPMYVKQYDGKLFTTYMNSNFSIAGRKRYPIHKNNSVMQTEDTGNTKVGTTFKPLKDGALFKGKIKYHNLKKAELGALLSALTFHNCSGLYYNIGLAKSLGYGKIAVDIKGIENIDEYLKEFEIIISEQIPNWRDSQELKELLSMAKEQNNKGESSLKYMILDDFSKYKTKENQDYLRNYTSLENISEIIVTSLLTNKELQELELKYQKFLEKEQEYKEKQKRKRKYLKSLEFAKKSYNVDFIESFLKNEENQEFLDEQIRKELNYKMMDIFSNQKEQEKKDLEEEINKQWDKVLKTDEKYQKNALEDFIKAYPSAKQIEKAKNILDSMEQSKKQHSFDLSNFSKFKPLAKNIKKIAGNKSLSEEQKIILEQKLLEIAKKDKIKNFKENDFNSNDLLGEESVHLLYKKICEVSK